MPMPGPAQPSVRYAPLSATRNDIRILLLQSGTGIHGQIECRIEHVPLSAASNYVALSYCWGQHDQLVPARVNGQTVHITLNLSDALTELRRRGYTRVWADALCVNQDDNAERGRQVPRMAAIYSSARTVVAWLGHADMQLVDGVFDLNDSIEALLRFNDRRDQYQALGQTHGKHSDVLTTKAQFKDTKTPTGQALRQRGLRRVVRGIRNHLDHQPLKHPHPVSKTNDALKCVLNKFSDAKWKPLKKLLNCEYWSRVWIIQELSMANDLVIIWERHDFTFFEIVFLVEAYRAMRKAELVGNVIPKTACQRIQNLAEFKRLQSQLEAVPLIRALDMTALSKATDLRDKVYGLIGLTCDGSFIFPNPRYDRGLRDLDEDATLRIIGLEKSLDSLVFRNQEPGSWPIDWFSSKERQDPRIASYLGRSTKFHLGNETYTRWAATKSPMSTVTVRNRGLVVKGAVIDTIRSCSATLEERQSASKPLTLYQARGTVPGDQLLDYKRLSLDIYRCLYLLRDERKGTLDESEFYSSIQFALSRAMYGPKEKSHTSEVAKPILDWMHCSMNSTFTLGGSTLKDWIGGRPRSWVDNVTVEKRVDAFNAVSATRSMLQMGMRLGRTTGVRVGWFAKHARPGDSIVILNGCSVPVVLRQQNDGSYTIIGDCIIPTIMRGEADDHARSEIRLS